MIEITNLLGDYHFLPNRIGGHEKADFFFMKNREVTKIV